MEGSDVPLWIQAEKLYGQRFYYNGLYMSTVFTNVSNPSVKKSKRKVPNKRKLRKSDKSSKQSLPSMNVATSLIDSFEDDRKRFCFPDPGEITGMLLKSFSIFHDGLNKLFPMEFSDSLSASLNNTDNMHIIVGLYNLLCKVDCILQQQILMHIKTLNSNVTLPGKTAKVIGNLIGESMCKSSSENIPRSDKKPDDEEDDANTTPGTWKISEKMQRYYITQHQIEFDEENGRYLCFVCGKFSTVNPASHIVNPSHIQALNNAKPPI